MVNHTPINERLGLADLMQRHEWVVLTSKQKVWASKYLSSGILTGTYDALGAAMAAYRTTPKNAVIISCQLMGNRRIKRVLDLHFRRSELDSIMDDLSRATRLSIARDLKKGGSLSVATIKAVQILRNYARQNPGAGIEAPEAEAGIEPDEPKIFAVGDHVWQAGVEYVVTKLKMDGTVDEAVEATNAVR